MFKRLSGHSCQRRRVNVSEAKCQVGYMAKQPMAGDSPSLRLCDLPQGWYNGGAIEEAAAMAHSNRTTGTMAEGTTPTLDRLVSEGIVWWDIDILGFVGRADDGVLVTFGDGGEATERYLTDRPTKDLW